MQQVISVDISAFKSAIKQLKRLEEFATEKAEFTSRYDVKNTDMLTVQCVSFAALQDLTGYLSDEDIKKLEEI